MSESVKPDEVQAPKQDRIGNDFREGTNPAPGGTIDTGDALVPPYEGRSDGENLTDEQKLRADDVQRALTGQDALEEPTQPESSVVGERAGKMAPSGVGESITRSAEDVAKADGKEPGRRDTGREGESGRPTGTSNARDTSAVDPQDPGR
jgi:hypothetical protein